MASAQRTGKVHAVRGLPAVSTPHTPTTSCVQLPTRDCGCLRSLHACSFPAWRLRCCPLQWQRAGMTKTWGWEARPAQQPGAGCAMYKQNAQVDSSWNTELEGNHKSAWPAGYARVEMCPGSSLPADTRLTGGMLR
jgi:hypothetical protein